VANDPQTLDDLLSGTWQRFATQGGKIERSPIDNSFLLSGLWLEVASRWIEIRCFECPEESWLEYMLRVSACEVPPIPEPSKMNNPPRKEMTDFPAGCRIDALLGNEPKIVEARILSGHGSEFFCAPPLILKTRQSGALRIHASSVSENIELEMDQPIRLIKETDGF
jgi:hypothetical protein